MHKYMIVKKTLNLNALNYPSFYFEVATVQFGCMQLLKNIGIILSKNGLCQVAALYYFQLTFYLVNSIHIL